MSKLVDCYFCKKQIGLGWKFKRVKEPTLFLCEDCFNIVRAVVRCVFPGILEELSDFAVSTSKWEKTGPLDYFEGVKTK
jgi:hypothetical protein